MLPPQPISATRDYDVGVELLASLREGIWATVRQRAIKVFRIILERNDLGVRVDFRLRKVGEDVM